MNQEEFDYIISYFLYLLPREVKDNTEYPFLNDDESEVERKRLAKIIFEKYFDKVFWNLCPKCNGLARTPKAKQCRHCYHDWH